MTRSPLPAPFFFTVFIALVLLIPTALQAQEEYAGEDIVAEPVADLFRSPDDPIADDEPDATADNDEHVEGLAGLGPPMRLGEARQGTLLLHTQIPGVYLPAPTLETEVEIHVTGLIARAAVVQRFHNPTSQWVEGVYVFPLPEKAAVDALEMRIGERVIVGEIREREEARKVYEQAKREGKKASLVEQERPNIFTNSVANIGPDETIEVKIEYQQDLRYDDGRFSLRFPMVVAPRFIPGSSAGVPQSFGGTGWAADTNRVPDASRITPRAVDTRPGEILNPVEMTVLIDAGLPLVSVDSPSHDVEVIEENGLHAVVFKRPEPADRDFELEWVPEVGTAPRAALFSEEKDGERFALLMVLPPHGQSAATARLPRETIFVIDVSGSMGGTSIEQARLALTEAIGRLRPEDRFNVVRFSNSAERLFRSTVPASTSYLTEARNWVSRLQAGGGTNIMAALRLSLGDLANVGDATVVRQVIFMTDGSVGNESELLRYISENLDDSRLFTIGIGSAPNSYFMTKAAEFGRGTFTYISDVQQVAEQMGELYRKLENPVMGDLEVVWDDPNAEAWPRRLGDLYAGEPLMVTVRGGGDGARVTGSRAGEPWEESFVLSGGAQAAGVAKLWARRKIAALMDGGHRGTTPAEEVRRQVVEVALDHHLVSKYTSLVAVDLTPTAPAGTVPETRALPVELPAGWTPAGLPAAAVLPRTATPGALQFVAGLMLLLIAGRLLKMSWRRA